MKVVKINNKYYGIIEDDDNLSTLIHYRVTIYNVEDNSIRPGIYSGNIKSVDEMDRILCSTPELVNGMTVLLPFLDEFSIDFSIIPTIISEARYKTICKGNNINGYELYYISKSIEYVLNSANFNEIKKKLGGDD